MKDDPLTQFGQALGSNELVVIGKIRSAERPEDRERLIAELEAIPEIIHPFYSRWLVIQKIEPFHCWTDSGYVSSLSDVPRDIQILAATRYGISDIENGGFHQFFTNSTGAFAPEMVEWFERAGMPEAGAQMKKAIQIFGEKFPRRRTERENFLSRFKGNSREEWDPFNELDGPFYRAVSRSDSESGAPEKFSARANEWLRKTCGITNLRATYQRAEQTGAGQPATQSRQAKD